MGGQGGIDGQIDLEADVDDGHSAPCGALAERFETLLSDEIPTTARERVEIIDR